MSIGSFTGGLDTPPRILSQLGLQIAVNEGLPSAVKSGCRSLAQFSEVYAVTSTVSISFPLMTVY